MVIKRTLQYDPQKMWVICQEKERLVAAHAEAVRLYAFAAMRLQSDRAKATRTDYVDLLIITDDARAQVRISNDELGGACR
jgi:hypothetical protein